MSCLTNSDSTKYNKKNISFTCVSSCNENVGHVADKFKYLAKGRTPTLYRRRFVSNGLSSSVVTHPSTNRDRRCLTLFNKFNAVFTTSEHRPVYYNIKVITHKYWKRSNTLKLMYINQLRIHEIYIDLWIHFKFIYFFYCYTENIWIYFIGGLTYTRLLPN